MSLERIKSLINNTQSNGNVPEAAVNVVKDNQNIFEENKTSYNQYNQTWDENWEDVEFTQDKALGFLWNVDSYTYTTSNGSTITVKKTDGITVKQNKKTGEIVIIGGNVEDINLLDKNNLTLIEATAKNINASSGDATIKIEGSHSSVASVTGGKGSQSVIVSAGAKVEHIKTGDDNDTVIVNHATVGKVETGSGSDGVIAYDSTITNNMDLGKDNDYVLLEESSVQGKLIATKGSNTIESSESELNGKIDLNTSDNDTNTLNLSKTNVNADIDAYNGNADITIENNSTLAEDKKIRTGYGNYNVTVNDSNLDGNFVASGFDGYSNYETLNLNLNNSSFNNISGLRDDDSTTFNSVNSRSRGAENLTDSNSSKREVVSLDTSKESEFEGFELIKPDSDNTRKTYTVKISETQTRTVSEEEWKQGFLGYFQLLSENVQNVYTLSDGTTVSINEGGQVYTNPSTGEIAINGADKAQISGNNNKNTKITVINSNVLSQNNVSGSVEYRNSNVDTITVSDSEDTQITVKDDSRIGDVTSSDSNLTLNISDTSKINNIESKDDGLLNINSNGGTISKIQSEDANIIGNIQNATIGTIKTTKGSIDIAADKSKIDKIENSNKDGETKLNLTNVTSDKISSKSKSEINLDNCQITSKVTASDYQDLINIIDSEVKNLEAKQGNDNLFIQGGSLDKLTASGMSETTLDGADIDNLNVQGNVAINKSKINSFSGYGNIGIKASEIDDLNVYGNVSNVDIEDSLIKNSYSLYDDNAHIDYFGNETNYGNLDESKLGIASSNLEKLSEQELDDVYMLLESLETTDSETISELTSQNLSKEEIIQRLNEAPSETLTQIKQGLIDEMQGAITTLEQALEDDKASGGSWWLTSIINSISNDINASNIQSKKEMLSKAIENGDFESLLNAHTILTDEISATNAITEYNNALTYANTISNEDIGNVLTTLNYIGNLMEYNITEQDGVIKNGIAYLNMYFDIGTNRAETQAYVQRFKDNVKALTDKYNAGTLSKEELVTEYKRLTGNSFTEENIQTILDNKRGNDAFSNIAQDKIEDYQQTQQTIFQVGEYAITIVAGSAVTLVSGGAAGPAIAASLSALGKMGIALTATTVSFLAKTAIDATERQTNGIVADNMTPEEVATSAALMYAGCLCGQFGNVVGDYIRGNGAEFFSQFISSEEMVDIATKVAGKTLEIGADTAASVLTTAMITGSGSFNEEFMQNLRSEMIGLIQSKITGAYFRAHPELQINTQLYSARKALTGVAEAEANIQILKNFGFSDTDAVKLSGLTSDEVDTIVVLRATNDLCEASLKAHGIDISKLSTEEKFEQGKIVDDLYANTDIIKQQTDSTCSVVSVLNAINEKPALIQALVNKFEYDASSDTYKFNMFGEDFEVKLNEGDNLLQKAYEAYQITFGDTKTSAIDVFNGMLDGASDIIVRPSVDNIAQLKAYSENDATILTFNTTDKIYGIAQGHSYTVLEVDDMGNMRLQDPETLEEITLMRSSYENKDCQIQGKTYKDEGLVEDGVELKLAEGAKTESKGKTFSEQPKERTYAKTSEADETGFESKPGTPQASTTASAGNTEDITTTLSRPLTEDEALVVEMAKLDNDAAQRIIDAQDNPNLTRTLSYWELKYLFSPVFSDRTTYTQDEIQRFIDIMDGNISRGYYTRGGYIEIEDAKLFIDNNLDDSQIDNFYGIRSSMGLESSEIVQYAKMGLNARDVNEIKYYGYSLEQAKKYAQLKYDESLDYVDKINIIRKNYDDWQTQRYLDLKKIGMSARSTAECIDKGYNDSEAEIYSRLDCNQDAHAYIRQLRSQDLSRELNADEALAIKDTIGVRHAQDFLDLKDSSEFSRSLTDSEAILAVQECYQPKEIQKMIDLLDNPKYKNILTLDNAKYIIDNDLSETEIKDYFETTVKLENFLNNTISIKRSSWFSYYTEEKSMGEWLEGFGVKPEDIKQDALDFVYKLNPEVVQRLTLFGDNNNYLARLLTKHDIFADVDFNTLSKNADFMNYLSETQINGKNLLPQVKDVAFLSNKDFDTEGMTRLIEAFKNVRITQPETNKYNFAFFENLSDGHNSIADILNSSTVDPIKAAEFLETLASTKITKSNGVECSFADILKEQWLYNSILDETIDYDKVTELCKYISESNMYPDLTESDISEITWLVNNVSKFSDPQEYFNAYNYFKNLTESDGSEMLSGRTNRMSQKEILSYMLNVDPTSVEASNIEMMIRLVQDGVVDKHIFEYLPSGGKLNPIIVSDLDKLYEAYRMGIKPIDIFIPTFKNATEAVSGGNDSILFKDTYLEVKVGDVFQVEGEDFIRIKTSDTESEQLNISKETYFKLFPPIERYASTQNNIGNCWEITGINSLFCESDTRASILRLFSQDGDDIVIKFPHGHYEEIRFKNGELPETTESQYYSKGALGIQMLEYADGKEIQGEWINIAYNKIKDMIANAPDSATRESFEKGLAEFTEFIESHNGNVVFNFNNGLHWEEYNGKYDSILSSVRVGGKSNDLYTRLGYSDAECLNFYSINGDLQKALNLLIDSKSFEEYIISWASEGKGIEESVNSELGIVTNHAYRIKPATIKDDGTIATFKLINPWGIVETELTYDQVLKYGKAIYIAKK